jgi:DnaJ-class molecular chaperone
VEKPKDFYGILGVPRDAPVERIKRAYRRLARRWHPDVTGGCAEQFRTLTTAYETLADAEARARYDRTLRHDCGTAVPQAVAYGTHSWAASPAATGQILLTPAEAASGGMLPLDVAVTVRCTDCAGSGGAFRDCRGCDGEGRRLRRVRVSLRVPPRVRDGEVFQLRLDPPSPVSVLLTVHVIR